MYNLNNILRRKVNWISHILRKNCLIRDAIEEQMAEVKEIGRRTQLLDDFEKQKKILGAEGGRSK